MELYDLARGLTGHVDLADAADVISKHIRRILPAATCVFYVFDEESDELDAAHAAGEHSSHFTGLRIPRGQRLTGWVAANKQAILNSDPVLDLERSPVASGRDCIAVSVPPLLDDKRLVGVLTVYSAEKEAFVEDHRRIIEVVARQVTQTVANAVEFADRRSAAYRDPLTGLPNRQHLTRLITSEMAAGGSSELSIVLIDLGRLVAVNRRHGRVAGDRLLGRVADAVRGVLRGADVLFRYDNSEFVVLLTQTGSVAADKVAERIATTVTSTSSGVSADETPGASATFGVATAPTNGTSLEELGPSARRRDSVIDTDPPATSVH